MSILFNRHVFSSSGSNHLQHSQDQLSVLLNVVCFIHLQVAFVFPALLPLFFFKDSDFLIKHPFILVKSLHSFLSMFLSGDSHEDSNGASSSSFSFFSSPVVSSQALLIISFSSFQIPSQAGAPLNYPLLLFYCSGVLKISRRFVFPLYIRSSSFKVVISF